MFDETLIKDLIELLGKSLNFKDIEAIGGYLFKSRAYDLHALAGVDAKLSISPLNAAKILVEEAERKGKLKDLFVFTIELDGSLRDGREYELAIASIDICQNSELVKQYKPKVMEQVYYRLWEFLKTKLDAWEGRIWSWAGDGGILAFRGEESVPRAVSCCLEILAGLAVFNMQPDKPIKEEICLRIALDFGPLKFFSETGKIISEVINYAAHLEKKGTKPSKLSISDAVHARLSPAMRKVFAEEMSFEGRTARSMA